MANNLDNSTFKEYYSSRMQVTHHKVDVFRAIANFEEAKNLKEGDTVNRPYRSKMVAQSYTRGTAFTVRDISKTNEQLTVTVAKVAPFYVDDLDALQSQHNDMNNFADDSVIVLANVIDGDVLGEYDQASSSVSNADMVAGGNSAHGITITTSNVQSLFSKAKMKLTLKNVINPAATPKVPEGAMRGKQSLFAVISPQVESTLIEYLAGKETALGDASGLSGHIGKYYGFDLYVSNSLGWSGELLMGTQPTDGDAVTFNRLGGTVTWTFETGTIDGNGEVKSETDAATSRLNLVNAINSPGTGISAKHSALSSTVDSTGYSDVDRMQGIVATDDTSNALITIKAEGVGYLVVGETLTAAADVWTTTKQIQHLLFGVKGAIEVVIQKEPNVEIKDVPDKIGKNVVPWTLYGLKTFTEGKAMLCDVKVRTDAYTAA